MYISSLYQLTAIKTWLEVRPAIQYSTLNFQFNNTSFMLFNLSTIFFSSFLLALSGALMPGPMLTVTISESIRRGATTGPLMILGHGLLELLLIIALVSGLAPYMNAPPVFIVISIIGGTILLWMACSMFRNLPTMKLITEADGTKYKNLIVTGALLSLINPYWLIWWATIGLGYIVQTLKYGIAGLTIFFIAHVIADLGWYALVSYGISRGRHCINDSHFRFLIGCCASFLLFFSAWFFYSGLDRYFHLETGLS